MRALDGRRVGGTVVKMALECRGGVLVWWNLFLTPAASYLGSKWFSGILGMRVSLCMDCCFLDCALRIRDGCCQPMQSAIEETAGFRTLHISTKKSSGPRRYGQRCDLEVCA